MGMHIDRNAESGMSVGKLLYAAAIGLSLPLYFVSSASARTIDYSRSGSWSIYAYFADNGAFGHCGMEILSKDGPEVLTILAGKSGYRLFLDSNTWSLNKGDEYGAKINIDGKVWNGKAFVYSTNGVVIHISYEAGFGEFFSGGSKMDFKIGNKSMTLGLLGSRKALAILLSCLNTYEPNANPFGEPSRKVTTPFD
ncbi:hypothetical protein [Azospirillum palustre]|uniref:hypothetical protein n=1 Tax=Azospirillum palustre TaxID=2044885 RepID=UPI001177BE24|nr:hypothetical protein [Azospirillum palustre]